MREGSRRGPRGAAALAIAAVACGLVSCSYGAIDAPLTVDVTAIPASAVRIDATLTDSAAKSTAVHPQFYAGQYATYPLVLSFAAPAPGAFSLAMQAFDANGVVVAHATPAGTWSGAPQQLQVAMIPGP